LGKRRRGRNRKEGSCRTGPEREPTTTAPGWKTLERSERLREESPRKSYFGDRHQSENLEDQPKGKDQGGSEETDNVASFGEKNSESLANLKRGQLIMVT
jgi:hypothetical protein